MRLLIPGTVLAIIAVACSAEPSPGPDSVPACTVSAPTSCPDPAPRYAEIASIIEARCASCHAGALGGPWPLHDYTHLADWQDSLRDQIRLCTMPPPEARVPITDEERSRILAWIRCGLPE